MAPQEIYEFGEFVLDVGERRLSRAGEVVPLAPKPYDLLVALVRRAETLVTKRELLDLVWPEVAVEEGVLSVHVSALRKAVSTGDETRSYIQTVSRAGYRFAVPVRRRQPATDRHPVRWPIAGLPAQAAVSDLIGRGRSHLLSASGSDVPKAVDAFQAAIVLEPTYAPGHAGLALACCARAELRLALPAEAYSAARAAALRALAMDDANADAQVALGTVLFLSDWNWDGAKRSLERALDLDHDHTEGLLVYGRLLEALGHLDDALSVKQKALERNPGSAAVHLQIALSYWNQRRYDEMIEWASRSLELDPTHLVAREYVAGAYLKKGDLDRHMLESIAHATAAGAPAEMIAELRAAYDADGRAGVVAYALRMNAEAPPVQLALLHGEAGHLDEAFRQLDAALERHDPALVHMAVAPQWDPLRADSRFEDRLRRMGLDAALRERPDPSGSSHDRTQARAPAGACGRFRSST